MRVEVVAVGTELLLGEIVDTNSAWLGEQLALSGIDHHYQVRVGDNLGRMVEVITSALERSDAVIVCGGLGPTQDDLTREALALVSGRPLVTDPDMEDRIAEMFSMRGRAMPANNLLQARRPEGSTFIPEQPGTAPGLVVPVGDGVVYAVPGVPWEMRQMVEGTILPDLRVRSRMGGVIRSRTLRTWGESESGLAERLAGRIAALDTEGTATLAFLASGIEGLKVRITVRADDDRAAGEVLDAEHARLEELLGDLVFGIDDETMEHAVLRSLEGRGLTLGVAESLTGGLVTSRLVAVPGASRVLAGGVVAYAPAVKESVLGVPPGPVVTEECARAMAQGVRRALGVDVGVATTGVAGPDDLEGCPPGTVCLAASGPFGERSVTLRLPGGRTQVREFSCISVLDLLRRALREDEGWLS